jgi:hypothetical protein
MVAVLVATLAPASAFAVDPPKSPPPEAPIAAPPPAVPATTAAPPNVPTRRAPAMTAATEPLPDPAVRMWMVATTPQGPWTMRLDNEGDRPVRIPADVRLLRFEIEPEPYIAPSEAAEPRPKKWAPPKKPAKALQCKLPAPLRPASFPDASSLLLRPGESYVESFDPRLFCFGKEATARLVGGAVVHVRFGWEPVTKPAWSATKKPDSGPFVVEGAAFPPEVMPLRELTAPTMVLHYGRTAKRAAPDAGVADPATTTEPSEPEAKAAGPSATDPKATDPRAPGSRATDPRAPSPSAEPEAMEGKEALPEPPVVDENAPRLELTATPFADASSTSRAAVTLTATNVGRRPMLLALHPRMFGFRIDGPDGVLRCSPMAPTHGTPRELFRSLKPGGSSSMTLLLAEGCTRDALRRPGLYRVHATLLAGESGSEIGLTAYTGTARTRAPALLRVLDGPDPFYAVAPRAIPTPRPAAPPEGDEGDE